MQNFTFEELEIIAAIGGSRKNAIGALSEILDCTDEEYGILEVLQSIRDKLTLMSDSDYEKLNLKETEAYYGE